MPATFNDNRINTSADSELLKIYVSSVPSILRTKHPAILPLFNASCVPATLRSRPFLRWVRAYPTHIDRLPQFSIPFLRLDVLTPLLIHRTSRLLLLGPHFAFLRLPHNLKKQHSDLRLLQHNLSENHPNMFAHMPT